MILEIVLQYVLSTICNSMVQATLVYIMFSN
jgi:hypothetical protein